MTRLFIHQPLFRLLSPVFSGVIVYLLILLIDNDVAQLQEQFLGQELYMCIGLSLVTQEFSRLLLWLFSKLPKQEYSLALISIQVVLAMLLTIALVTISITIYFDVLLGYSPNSSELWLFNSIFCVVTFIYILLHISHQYLYKVNTEKLNNEQLKKQLIEDDFKQFKKGINPDLLFESLESLIVIVRQNPDKVDDIIDHLAIIYRYILSRKERQLVEYSEEKQVLRALLSLFKFLPYRALNIQDSINSKFLIVPGTLLNIAEYIVKTTIVDLNKPLEVKLIETDDVIEMQYVSSEKISNGTYHNKIEDIKQRYNIYSDKMVESKRQNGQHIISVPKLIIN